MYQCRNSRNYLAMVLGISAALTAIPAEAQTLSTPAAISPSVSQSTPAPIQLAQRQTPSVLPTDSTPYTLQGGQVFTPGFRYRLFQKLPERMFFTLGTDVSQRLDTNVFFTHGHYRPDYAFRVNPNVTAGYNIFGNTSVYSNWFLIKDVFAVHSSLNGPTTQSLSGGIRQDFPIGNKANLQFDFQARELWSAPHVNNFDYLPAVNLQIYASPTLVLFGSALLQLRGTKFMKAPTSEIDPFYSVGMVKRIGKWNFLASNTLVNNFRSPPFNRSISNSTMIADFEVSRPVTTRLPGLDGYLRVEPIFNWGGQKVQGLSGTDIRVMGGLRFNISKPSYAPSVDRVRKQLIGSDLNEPATPLASATPAKPEYESQPSTATSEPVPAAQPQTAPLSPPLAESTLPAAQQ